MPTMWDIIQDIKKFKLGDPRTYHYLNQTSCFEVPYVNDAKEYLETRNAMDVVGITTDEQVLVSPMFIHPKCEFI